LKSSVCDLEIEVKVIGLFDVLDFDLCPKFISLHNKAIGIDFLTEYKCVSYQNILLVVERPSIVL